MKKSFTHGTLDQFQNEVETKLNELRSLESCTNIESSTNLNSDEIERYYHTLIREIEDELLGEFDNIIFDIQPDNSLKVTVINNDKECSYKFTSDEFTFDWNELNSDPMVSEDVCKVVNTIRSDYDGSESDVIQASKDDYMCWEEAILDVLNKQGYNIKAKSVKSYAEGAADLMSYSSDKPNYLRALDWYNETCVNYPEDLENLPKRK